jgi:hypothetical protein
MAFRIDLPDGRWVELRSMWLSDKNRIIDLEKREEEARYLDMVNEYASILRPAVVALSWEGDISDMPELEMLRLIPEWGRLTTEDVLPEANGTSSATSSRNSGTRCRVRRPAR